MVNLGSEVPIETENVFAYVQDAQCENKCCSLFSRREGLFNRT